MDLLIGFATGLLAGTGFGMWINRKIDSLSTRQRDDG